MATRPGVYVRLDKGACLEALLTHAAQIELENPLLATLLEGAARKLHAVLAALFALRGENAFFRYEDADCHR